MLDNINIFLRIRTQSTLESLYIPIDYSMEDFTIHQVLEILNIKNHDIIIDLIYYNNEKLPMRFTMGFTKMDVDLYLITIKYFVIYTLIKAIYNSTIIKKATTDKTGFAKNMCEESENKAIENLAIIINDESKLNTLNKKIKTLKSPQQISSLIKEFKLT